MPTFKIHHGDCVSKMREMADNSVDSIVTDPPYELGFMGKKWDSTGIAYSVEMWQECLRVLKPGGHVLAFSGSRTYHRMTCAIEDAGFEVRDQIMWIYGSGFPKSHNLTGDWQGWGTALKPAHEPICVARKPLIGTVAANVLAHGTGAMNIDGCRVEAPDGVPVFSNKGDESVTCYGNGLHGSARTGEVDTTKGRWPANLIHDGSEEVLAGFPDGAPAKVGRTAKRGGSNWHGRDGLVTPDLIGTWPTDNGVSAARFFYCAKASKADRSEGNIHPTVKPIDLMRYLCRLVTQPGGIVLDPFTGSGSTGKAAMLEGFNFVGCEMNEEYVATAKARIESVINANVEQDKTMDLFA